MHYYMSLCLRGSGCDISETASGNSLKFGTNIHFVSMSNQFCKIDFGGEMSKVKAIVTSHLSCSCDCDISGMPGANSVSSSTNVHFDNGGMNSLEFVGQSSRSLCPLRACFLGYNCRIQTLILTHLSSLCVLSLPYGIAMFNKDFFLPFH